MYDLFFLLNWLFSGQHFESFPLDSTLTQLTEHANFKPVFVLPLAKEKEHCTTSAMKEWQSKVALNQLLWPHQTMGKCKIHCC